MGKIMKCLFCFKNKKNGENAYVDKNVKAEAKQTQQQ